MPMPASPHTGAGTALDAFGLPEAPLWRRGLLRLYRGGNGFSRLYGGGGRFHDGLWGSIWKIPFEAAHDPEEGAGGPALTV